MKNSKHPPSEEEGFIRRMNALDDGESLPPEEVRSLARQSGIDLAKSLAVALSQVQEAKKDLLKEQLDNARRERALAAEQLNAPRRKRSKAENLAVISHLTAMRPAGASAHAFHRNFETATDDDIASLAAELESLAGEEKK